MGREVPFPGLDIQGFSDIGRDFEAEDEINEAIESMKIADKKRSLLTRLFTKSRTKTIRKELGLELTPDINKLDTVFNLLVSARRNLSDLKTEDAKEDYLEMMKLYKDLRAEEKALVYNDIKDVYNERKNAEIYN